MYAYLQCAQEQDRRQHLIVGRLLVGLDDVLQHADRAPVVLVGLHAELLATKLVVGGHLSDAQGGRLEDAMAVVVQDARQEAQVAWEAVSSIGRDKPLDEVAEGGVFVGCLRRPHDYGLPGVLVGGGLEGRRSAFRLRLRHRLHSATFGSLRGLAAHRHDLQQLLMLVLRMLL